MGRPTGVQIGSGRSNSGVPAAKPSTGRVKPITASAPAPLTTPTMNRRRVTVSPSNAPGMLRSVVYFDLGVFRGEATAGPENLGRGDYSLDEVRRCPVTGRPRPVTRSVRT